VFLVGQNGALVEVQRTEVAVEDAQDLLDALLKAPTNTEANHGLRSAVPPGTKATAVTRRDVAIVDLESQFLSAARTEQALAVAQIVYTMTSIPGISTVRFLLDGEAVDIPRSDGTLTRSPLGRTDVGIVVPG
jgi:spore germination protein GerM